MVVKLYKTYNIEFKVPNNEHLYREEAWPAYNDRGDLLWTLCKDDITVIEHKYITKYVLK